MIDGRGAVLIEAFLRAAGILLQPPQGLVHAQVLFCFARKDLLGEDHDSRERRKRREPDQHRKPARKGGFSQILLEP